jgi:acylglycerol lipase
MSWMRRLWYLPLAAALALGGCTASFQPMGLPTQHPNLSAEALTMPDGARLPVRTWLPASGPPWALVVALHGMNDYSYAFDQAAQDWAYYGVATYAYDQRGFGASARPGIWSSADTMVADLNTAVDAASARHPGLPVYVLGESMGGAVVATALAAGPSGQEPPLARHIAGAILSAPALWGRQSMNVFYSFALWLAYAAVPGMPVEPPRGLKIMPSDNIDMLRALGRDPLVLKQTRIDTLKGLLDLMSLGESALPHLPRDLPMLVMFGHNEQVLPKEVVADTLRQLETMRPGSQLRIALYDDGYHLLLRDLHADMVWRDVLTWMRTPTAALPSGADSRLIDPAQAAPHAPSKSDSQVALPTP